MKNTTHRVVILKNVNSNLISQAILILKDSASEGDSGLMLEAERIVEKYMCKKASPPAIQKKPRYIGIISAGVVLLSLCALLIAYLR